MMNRSGTRWQALVEVSSVESNETTAAAVSIILHVCTFVQQWLEAYKQRNFLF